MQKAFILGNPRSGTSLMRIMLNSHRDIIAPPECGFMQWWYEKYKNWSIQSVNSSAAIKEFVTDLLSSKKIETWSLDEQRVIDQLIDMKPDSYAELSASIFLLWGRLKGKSPSVIIDKNNYYIDHLNDLMEIWPDAKYLFLVRDGRDVACSYKDLKNLITDSPYRPALPVTIDDIAREWQSNNMKVWNFLNLMPSQRWLMVRFEELVKSPQEQLMKISSFLKVSYDAGMLEYYARNDEPSATLDWKKKTMEKPDVDNIGKYKNRLTLDEINLFNNLAGEMLMIAGYDR